MKDFRSENLSEHLTEVDDELLERAYEIDNAEKLQSYIKDQNKKPHHAAVFRRVAVIAACLILVFGFLPIIPALMPANSVAPGDAAQNNESVPPWLRDESEYVAIESLDMLNYYTAVKLLAENTKTAAYRTNENGVMLLSASEKSYDFSFISDIGYDDPLYGEDSERGGEASGEKPSESTEKVYYYELDPNETFTVTSVVFFQIRIKNENGFLASKIGTGTADVVITENSLEPMITFKNGDRYYSCCEISLTDNGKIYSTHKYIEGFYIVKNLEQENYSFEVVYNNFNLDYKEASAVSVICCSYKNGGSAPDGAMTVNGKTYISKETGAFTVRGLEEYFNSGKLPSGKLPENSGSAAIPSVPGETVKADVYVGGGYVFELDPDGVFIYHSEESHDASYRKGTYTLHEDGTELLFYDEGEIAERAFCAFSGGDGFVYNGIKYVKSE